MAISTNPKPTIYRNLYENTGPVSQTLLHVSQLSDIILVIIQMCMMIMYPLVAEIQHVHVCLDGRCSTDRFWPDMRVISDFSFSQLYFACSVVLL